MSQLNIVEKVLTLEAVELLRSLHPDQLARIASIAREQTVQAGAVIIEPNKAPDALFVILEGAVDLRSPDGAKARAERNEVLGAWALFDPEPLNITAVAADASRLLRIGRDDFYDLLSDNVEITAAIFATLVKRFRRLVEGGRA
jgi:CRP-like cAMP-binding protein